MKRLHFVLWTVLMVSATVLTACGSQSDEVISDVTPQKNGYHFCINVSKGEFTRALALGSEVDGAAGLLATWSTSDVVKVFRNKQKIGELHPLTGGSHITQLVGDISGSFSVGDKLDLTFLVPDNGKVSYSGQNGTLSNIAAHYDYAATSVTVTGVDDETQNVTTDDATFHNLQAVCKFTFPVAIKMLTISSGSRSLVGNMGFVNVTLDSPSTEVFVAMKNVLSGQDQYTLTVQTESDEYESATATATLENSKYYPVTIPNLTPVTSVPENWGQVPPPPPGTVLPVDSLPNEPHWWPFLADNGFLYRNATQAEHDNAELIALVVAWTGGDEGLAMALHDCDKDEIWSTASVYLKICADSEGSPCENWVISGYDTEDVYMRYGWVNTGGYVRHWTDGETNTDNLINCTGGWEGGTDVPKSHSHPAAIAARNYGVTPPSNATSWFLPSPLDWAKAAWGIGGVHYGTNPYGADHQYPSINEHIAEHSGGGTLLGDYEHYWLSAPTWYQTASTIRHSGTSTTNCFLVFLNDLDRTEFGKAHKVRPFLKFRASYQMCGVNWYTGGDEYFIFTDYHNTEDWGM